MAESSKVRAQMRLHQAELQSNVDVWGYARDTTKNVIEICLGLFNDGLADAFDKCQSSRFTWISVLASGWSMISLWRMWSCLYGALNGSRRLSWI